MRSSYYYLVTKLAIRERFIPTRHTVLFKPYIYTHTHIHINSTVIIYVAVAYSFIYLFIFIIYA
jgi:hypothetical protein